MINQVEEHFLARDTDVDGENKAGRHEQNQNPPDSDDDDDEGGWFGRSLRHGESLVGTLVFRPCEVLAPPLLPYLVRACVSRLSLSGGVLAARKGTRSTHDARCSNTGQGGGARPQCAVDTGYKNRRWTKSTWSYRYLVPQKNF